MKTQRRTADEQYQLIMECRNSGLSDYQWCTEHDINPGTFYNWVKRLRRKACYDIPSATGRGDYKPVLKQDVVKLEVIPDHQESPIPSVGSTMLPVEETRPAIEIMLGTISIKISNDVDPKLLSQVLKTVTGIC
jgi:transposase-like protein